MKPPPKQRHRERPTRQQRRECPPQTDPNAYSAPSHTSGQFDEHGYGSGHGAFGFTNWTTP